MSVAAPAIALDRVSKVFPGGFGAVWRITLDIQRGEVLVIVGTSGSGKTTTMKMINRLIEQGPRLTTEPTEPTGSGEERRSVVRRFGGSVVPG